MVNPLQPKRLNNMDIKKSHFKIKVYKLTKLLMTQINLQRIKGHFVNGRRHAVIRTLLLIWGCVGLSFINIYLNYKQKELYFTRLHVTRPGLKREISLMENQKD